MFCNLLKWSHLSKNIISIRYMTTTEIAAALRPFYFSVHPDLFGKYPYQQLTNENSLKHLSSFIESIQSRKSIQPCTLDFFVRNKDNAEDGVFYQVQIKLQEADIRTTIIKILKSCNLSTEYIEKLPKVQQNVFSINIDWGAYSAEDLDSFMARREDEAEDRKEQQNVEKESNLKEWLEKNHATSVEVWKQQKPIREEMARLQRCLATDWGLKDVRWENGWNEQHFRGCLRSLLSMAEQHPDMIHFLQGRTLVFGPFTGVSIDGDIFLNSGEVRHNWLDFIRKIPKYDLVLQRIPAFEKMVSQVLRNIKVVRRKFMPKIVAGEYEKQLVKITTTVSDYWGKNSYPKEWPNSLSNYEIVIENDSGPLMLSPTGQLIVPASCPAILLVKFITEKLEEALLAMEKYQRDKYIEERLQQQCIQELGLLSLSKSDNVSPDIMIHCCERLLEHKEELIKLNGLNVNISNYYSVLTNGIVCIPWNWEL